MDKRKKKKLAKLLGLPTTSLPGSLTMTQASEGDAAVENVILYIVQVIY